MNVQRAYHRHLIGKYGEAHCPTVVAKDKQTVRYVFDHPEPILPTPQKLSSEVEEGCKLAVKWSRTLDLQGVSIGAVVLLYQHAVGMGWISAEMNEVQQYKAFLSFLSSSNTTTSEGVNTAAYPKKFKDFWTRELEADEVKEFFLRDLLVQPFYAAPASNVEALLEYAKEALHVMDSDPSQVAALFTAPKAASDFDLVAYSENELTSAFISILKEAAGDRFPLIHLCGDGKRLYVRMNPQTSFSLTVLGPVNAAENAPAIKRFKELWGNRAELRKFAAEGAIRCCVVFEEAAGDRLQLGSLILEHLSEVHLPEEAELRVPYESFKGVYAFESLQGVVSVYEEFGRGLRAVKGLPLSIVETVPLGSTLCSLSSHVPSKIDNDGSSGKSNELTSVQQVMLIFEKSGKWPNDLQAIKNLKLALLLALSNYQFFKPSFSKRNTPSTTSISDEGFMDVWYNGYVFRLYVFCEVELSVLQGDNLDAGEYWRDWIARPMHYRLMGQLVPKYALFAPACRLFKHWVRKHRLTMYLDEMTCELLMASVFLSSQSICNLAVALYKVFQMMRTMDSCPVVVDIDGSLDREAVYNDFYRLKGNALIFVTSPSIQQNQAAYCKTLPKHACKYIMRMSTACSKYLEEYFSGRIPSLTELFTPQLPNAMTQLQWNPVMTGKEASAALTNLVREECIGSAPFMRCMPGFDLKRLILQDMLALYPQAQIYPDEDYVLVGGDVVISDLLLCFPGAFLVPADL